MSLPNFFVIGAPKSGTTTLHEVLRDHESVAMAAPKEPAFFSNEKEYRLGLDYYRRTYFRGVGHELAIGDATPWYLYSEESLERIRSDLPGSSHRFVCILREPIGRACSQYWDQYHLGLERRSLKVALRDDMGQPGWPEGHDEELRSYLRCSRYEYYLPRFIDAFGADRVLILLQDDLRHPESRLLLYRRLFEFLGLPTGDLAHADVSANAGKGVRSRLIESLLRSPAGKEGQLRARISKIPALRGGVRRWASRISRLNRVSVDNPSPPAELYEQLAGYFRPTIDFVEDALGRTVDGWEAPSDPSVQP